MKIQLIGGGLINLVFAEYLYKNNKEFSWYTLGEKVGGHFSGMNIDGNFLDLGMVLLEFGTNNINTYDGIRNIKMFNALMNYFQDFKTDTASIGAKFNSTLHPDYIISDNCELIWGHKFSSNLSMESPSLKWKNNYFDAITYDEYCMRAYPEFYSMLLEGFANKISFGGHRKMSCRYHRSAWLPLYYPDTISGQNKDIKIYPFRKFSGRSVADVINEKLAYIKSRKKNLINEEVQNLDGLLLGSVSDKKFVSCDLKKIDPEYIDLLNQYTYQTKINIAIFSCDNYKAFDFDCINDIDDEEIYRVFFQSTSGRMGYIVVEGAGTFDNDIYWPSRAKLYLESNFKLNEINLKFSRSFMNGPRLPLPGAETILNHIKSLIDMKYGKNNFFNYGIQDGFQALSMNRQISHAMNEWRGLI
jgi:hypothetical protein